MIEKIKLTKERQRNNIGIVCIEILPLEFRGMFALMKFYKPLLNHFEKKLKK